MPTPTIPATGSVPPTFRPDLAHITHPDKTVFQVLKPVLDDAGNPVLDEAGDPVPPVEWDEAATAAVAAAYAAVHGGD
ncbi:MAG: hypothetical protein IM628_12740 [Phenylobacterium sp.]|uniref:hypothetical protein n=1 Tax=Phenylobacterium sp. TaxID=1871053 RepID=UPI0025D72257|nr:hypothetical protein [Phenylobacterium sp.]MCA6305665.1 hypothetical protein [Phenylobacterium sp.]